MSKPLTGTYQFTNALSGHNGIGLFSSLIASTGALYVSSGSSFGLEDTAGNNSIDWSPNNDIYSATIGGGDAWFGGSFSPTVVGGAWTLGTAAPSAVPEIDPATGGSALSLVAGVLAMIEQRRRRAMLVA